MNIIYRERKIDRKIDNIVNIIYRERKIDRYIDNIGDTYIEKDRITFEKIKINCY